MSCVTLGATPRDVPHLTRRGGQWVVLIRLGAPGVFAAMRWADWKNGRHDWYAKAMQKTPEWLVQRGTWSGERYRK
jgi:hypothetical protein